MFKYFLSQSWHSKVAFPCLFVCSFVAVLFVCSFVAFPRDALCLRHAFATWPGVVPTAAAICFCSSPFNTPPSPVNFVKNSFISARWTGLKCFLVFLSVCLSPPDNPPADLRATCLTRTMLKLKVLLRCQSTPDWTKETFTTSATGRAVDRSRVKLSRMLRQLVG